MRGIASILMIICGVLAQSQNKQLLYGVDDLPQSLLLNPGTAISFEKHIGVPFLSGTYVSAGSSGVSVHDIFREGGDLMLGCGMLFSVCQIEISLR